MHSALTDLLFRPEVELADAADRHFAPDYRQRAEGRWDERDGFVERIAHLRSIVARPAGTPVAIRGSGARLGGDLVGVTR